MVGQHRRSQEDARFRILRLSHENPERSQRELAATMGISAGGVLNALIDKGLVNLKTGKQRQRTNGVTPMSLRRRGVRRTRRWPPVPGVEHKIAENHALRAEIETLKAELDTDMVDLTDSLLAWAIGTVGAPENQRYPAREVFTGFSQVSCLQESAKIGKKPLSSTNCMTAGFTLLSQLASYRPMTGKAR